MSSTSPSSASSYPLARDMTGRFFNLGLISAVLSLFVVPEMFGPVAILLGAYTWRKEQANRGRNLVILGIVCMLVGLYLTALLTLGDLLLS